MTFHEVFDAIERDRPILERMAREIWESPELGLHEERSAALLREALADEGFDLEVGIGGMPTAFIATYGEGDATVGILGEYDALPGLSQRVCAERDPVEEGEPGHGCGHNLFGVAGVGAALGVKRKIEDGDLEGTIKFFGCPAEETLVGKVFMARAGAFDDLDAALTWHPGDVSTPRFGRTLAMDSIQFCYDGIAAHASVSPESGRSALDAVSLLNTGVEYAREHLPDSTRIHYVITDGGEAPNVVPSSATVWYYVRAPTRGAVEFASDWLGDIAAGAARMTRTDLTRRDVTGCWDYLPNRVITDAIWETMTELGSIEFADEDLAFAEELQGTLAETQLETTLEDVPDEHVRAMSQDPLYGVPVPAHDDNSISGGSTDVGDVSWIVPTGQFRAATWPVGTPAHSWQAVAANGDFGIEGGIYAAKVLAGTAILLLDTPSRLERAQSAFRDSTGDRSYESPVDEGTEPPFDITAG
ncbi:amidohydrolase [Natrialbaceae archaeon A-CW2]